MKFLRATCRNQCLASLCASPEYLAKVWEKAITVLPRGGRNRISNSGRQRDWCASLQNPLVWWPPLLSGLPASCLECIVSVQKCPANACKSSSLFECQILKYHLEVSRSCDSGALNAPAERMQTAWDDCSGELNCSFINLPCESMMSSVPSEFGLRSPRPPTQAAILSPSRREGPAFINDSRSKRRRT